MKNPSVEDLVGSRLGCFNSNPNDKLKKGIMLAKDTGILGLEITFHRHSTKKIN